MLTAGVVTAVIAVALGLAMQLPSAGSVKMLLLIGAPYAVISAFALVRMHRDGELGSKLWPRRGDLAIGAAIATVLYLLAFGVSVLAVTPGSTVEQWIMRVYLQLGDPRALQAHWPLLTVAVLLIAVCEEITWRGLVASALAETVGSSRAWALTAGLYAIAHLPTMFALRLPGEPLNPLIAVAALGCGLVWGLTAWLAGRLSITAFSHALFTWAIVLQFPLWSLH
jgi:membrane protease YdiL (CAAX protease family)